MGTERPLCARRMLGGSWGSHCLHNPEADCIVILKTRELTHHMVIGHCHRSRKLQSRDHTQVCLTPEATFSGPALCVPGPRGFAAPGISQDASSRSGWTWSLTRGTGRKLSDPRRPSLGVRSRDESWAKARSACHAPTGADTSGVSVL